MPGTNNFLLWDSTKTNLMSDSNYNASTWRTGGNKAGIAPADVYNKLFYQTSIFATAMTQAMANWGQNVSDSDLATLITECEKQMCLVSGNVWKFGNGLMIQTKQSSTYTLGVLIPTCSIVWDVPFYDANYPCLCNVGLVANENYAVISSERRTGRSVSGVTYAFETTTATVSEANKMVFTFLGIGRWRATS